MIKDQKKRQELAEVIGKKRFNPRAYRQMLKHVAGTISKKKHPQWSTRSKLEKWLRTSRIAAQRY